MKRIFYIISIVIFGLISQSRVMLNPIRITRKWVNIVNLKKLRFNGNPSQMQRINELNIATDQRIPKYVRR